MNQERPNLKKRNNLLIKLILENKTKKPTLTEMGISGEGFAFNLLKEIVEVRENKLLNPPEPKKVVETKNDIIQK